MGHLAEVLRDIALGQGRGDRDSVRWKALTLCSGYDRCRALAQVASQGASVAKRAEVVSRGWGERVTVGDEEGADGQWSGVPVPRA